MKKFLVCLSLLLLLFTLIVCFLLFYPLVQPLESIPFLSSIIATMLYFSSIATFYAIYMVPQIIFVAVLAVILWMTFRSRRKGTLTLKTGIAVGILNGISLVVMLSYTMNVLLNL